jgi:hypothetical protein
MAMPKDDSNYISLPHSTVRRENLRYILFLFLQLKSRLYDQDPALLRVSTHQLVGMCEAGVDLAWEEAGRAGPAHPLPESHPLVRTERAVWEVRAAGRLLLTSIQVNIFSHEEKLFFLTKKISFFETVRSVAFLPVYTDLK